MARRRLLHLSSLLLLSGAGLAACAKTPPAPSTAGAPRGCAPAAAAPVLRPLGDGTGGTVVLARAGDRTIAFVADEDGRSVVTFDLAAPKPIGVTPLAGVPAQMLLLRDGRLVVTLRDKGQVAILEPESDLMLNARCAVETAPEPVALAATADGSRVSVVSAWGQELRVFDTRTFLPTMKSALPREPRGVVVSDDDRTAYVVHAVGSTLSLVSLDGTSAPVSKLLLRERVSGDRDDGPEDGDRRRVSCQSFTLAKSAAPAGRILVPEVLVDTGDPSERSEGYGDGDTAAEIPHVAVIDQGTRAPLATSLELDDAQLFADEDTNTLGPPCLLPRASAVDDKTGTLIVSCLGIDSVVAYDVASASPGRVEKHRWEVPAGPSGVAVDGAGRRAVVWSQFDRSLTFIPLDTDLAAEGKSPPRLASIRLPELGADKLSRELALGRELFNAVGDKRISKDGRACASCHPDGRDDALTWATPDGPRRSIMLTGRLTGTAPYSWSGNGADLKEHITHTLDRLGGTGLKSAQLDALVAYVSALRPPVAAGAANDPSLQRGRQIFESKEAGCSSCHATDRLTDGKRHDVASHASGDKLGAFDTPSLRFVGVRGPYFHDGRYATLRDVLVRADGTMGHTSHLSPADLDALEAYVRSL